MRILNVIFDPKLFVLVSATAFSNAAGHITNNFYDAEKDKIYRPKKVSFENFISLQSQLGLYFLISGATLIATGFVPFYAITVYFKYFETIVVYHATLLFLVILTRDMIKY